MFSDLTTCRDARDFPDPGGTGMNQSCKPPVVA